jgi:hypothetical protein
MTTYMLPFVFLAAIAEDPPKKPATTPLVIVLRIQPRESGTIELDRPDGGFRPSVRQADKS